MPMLHRTKGGSSETEVKLFAVIPTGFPSSSTVDTIVTPVANFDKTFLKFLLSFLITLIRCFVLSLLYIISNYLFI